MSELKTAAISGQTVYYLADYIPWSRHKLSGGDSSNYDSFSGRILDFKDRKPAAVAHFATALGAVQSDLIVCAVPSHDPAKGTGAIDDLISLMCASNPGSHKIGLLVRHTKIAKLASGGPRSVDIHLQSLKVNFPNSVANADVLVVDDVVTTGGSLLAASRLLYAAGAKSVVCLALGKTQ